MRSPPAGGLLGALRIVTPNYEPESMEASVMANVHARQQTFLGALALAGGKPQHDKRAVAARGLRAER